MMTTTISVCAYELPTAEQVTMDTLGKKIDDSLLYRQTQNVFHIYTVRIVRSTLSAAAASVGYVMKAMLITREGLIIKQN